MPTTKELGGITVFSFNTAPAAMMVPEPIWQPLNTMAPIPTNTLSSIVLACTIAP